MRRTIRLGALCAIVLATGLREVRADGNSEAKALFEKVDAQMYYPQDQGLKDLSCSMASTMFKMNPMTAKMKILLYWKSPGKRAAKLDGVDDSNPMMAQMGEQMKRGMGRMVDMIVRERRSDHLDRYDYVVDKDGELTRVTGTLKEGMGKKGDPETEVFWVDAQARMARMEMETEAGKVTVADIKFVEKGGKLLWESMSQSGGAGGGGMRPGGGGKSNATSSFEYTQVKDYWVISKMSTTSPMMQNMKMVMEFSDYRVNEGIDDSVFEEETERGDDSTSGGSKEDEEEDTESR
ncbi:MAG: hypothetical protein HYY93_00255 [Planctomycetes bacterium]|nr:hypothetical protein [Planctomycetota bacterium]